MMRPLGICARLAGGMSPGGTTHERPTQSKPGPTLKAGKPLRANLSDSTPSRFGAGQCSIHQRRWLGAESVQNAMSKPSQPASACSCSGARNAAR